MLGYSEAKVTPRCVWVFFAKNFNSYFKSTLMGLEC